jgi:glycosyltransferase involved in cell wall biosynthesis
MKIAVLIPCYNEEKTIEKVVKDFRKELPDADIYVYDNNSKDNSAKLASRAGAIIGKETKQGKGNVVRTMFREVESDCYILVDADDTYPAEEVHKLINPIKTKSAHMVIGDRLTNGKYSKENKRPFHGFGNWLVVFLINLIFKNNLKDVMTGYRAFSKSFIKSYPIINGGFEMETEMTIHALDKNFTIREIPIAYRDRPEGSQSKLSTYKDGVKVITTIIELFKDYKPLLFFIILAGFTFLLSLIIGIPVVFEFIQYDYVYKVPSAILSAALMLLSTLFLICGLILDTVVNIQRQNFEISLLRYLSKERENN